MSTMYEEIPTSMEEFSKSIKAKAAEHGISCDISMDREAIARGLALEESDRKQKVAEILKRQPAAARAAQRLVSAIAIQSVRIIALPPRQQPLSSEAYWEREPQSD